MRSQLLLFFCSPPRRVPSIAARSSILLPHSCTLTMASAEPDELYTLRNLFWLGNFQVTNPCRRHRAKPVRPRRLAFAHRTHCVQLAINEASGLKKNMPAHLVTEKEEYVYRSYLALGQFHIILNEIKDTGTTPICTTQTRALLLPACVPQFTPLCLLALKAIKLLATVLADAGRKDAALVQVTEWLADPVASASPTLQLVAAILYIHDDNLKDAVKAVHKGANMEQHALLTQVR